MHVTSKKIQLERRVNAKPWCDLKRMHNGEIYHQFAEAKGANGDTAMMTMLAEREAFLLSISGFRYFTYKRFVFVHHADFDNASFLYRLNDLERASRRH